MEFHISSQSRIRYQFDSGLFRYDGNVIFADFQAVREFTQKINDVRLKTGNHEPVYAGLVNSLGLIDEIMHYLIDLYRENYVPELNQQIYRWLEEKIGKEALNETLKAFCEEFPPLNVYQGKITVEEYLDEVNPKGKLNRYEAIEEMLLLWITNQNPAAMKPLGELFDDKQLENSTAYNDLISEIQGCFQMLPKVDGMTLVDFLLEPIKQHPDSLFDQLEFIRSRWGTHLGIFLRRLLMSLDWMKEESKAQGVGPGPVEIPVYNDGSMGAGEYEAFSEDRDWMPRVVLIAKNTYVWLDQLSKQYHRPITKLNEIPEEELSTLRDQGFTGLWLIGVWERSKASAKIKQYCGNPEALASAYSIADYRIADDLGGENGFRELKNKAWRYGIRLASDMVPNHMGIDSEWVLYHPDRFLSLPYSPFPSYTFNGPNYSPDPNIGIYIEDHYYTREDAAVVFQRVDYPTGDVRYIYHGNDGTSMPWNDTAQLNYLNPEVRETVIQTILQVAKRFPIIRFDAAMTLAKKHYQRLWFPEPGTGGAIPSRAEFSMTKADFDKAFPVEFWREVVDRVAAEAPDTLLLAEAFWLMEGYFVRTLGMHRVYNSAFMNLLRDEDNAKYRILLKSTLEFDPDILKRYVNFMNNPDEKTAVEQFGKGDKYFGICTMMVTMPGLPMFGHGQIQGFKEKYGMEYRKAYWDEYVDTELLHRHEREIFPLLHQRRRFAEVTNFVLYNFATAYGNVDENVFAYSNYGEGHHSLVVYNNRFGDTKGYIMQSVPFVVKQSDGEKYTTQKMLSESLHLHNDPECFVVFHDSASGLNYVRPSQQIWREGLYLELYAYQYYVFNDVYEVRDDSEGTWRKLNSWLNGSGTLDLNDAIQELLYHYVLDPYRNCFNGRKLRWLYGKIGLTMNESEWLEIQNSTWPDFEKLMDAFDIFYNQHRSQEGLFNVYCYGINEFLTDPERKMIPGMTRYNAALSKIKKELTDFPELWIALFISLQQVLLARFGRGEAGSGKVENILDDWHLYKAQERILTEAGFTDHLSVSEQINLIQWLYTTLADFQKWDLKTLDDRLNEMLKSDFVRHVLRTNTYQDVLWFNKEAAETFSVLLELIGFYGNVFDPAASASYRIENLMVMQKAAEIFTERVRSSEYHYDRLFVEIPSIENPDRTAAPQEKPKTDPKSASFSDSAGKSERSDNAGDSLKG
ncbi:MAG TPA: alpha-amylase family glycosyl hydrolase [Flexilinea sp.]|nr:alpha-amylase family glycosyl hydrolase [Flexilinea sp.]